MNSGLTSVPYCSAWEALDLAYRHAAGVHGDDLVVEAGEAALVLGDEQRLEAAFAVARHVNPYRPILGQDGLAAHPIAVVAAIVRPRLAGRVAQVVGELGPQRALDQRLLERHRRGLHRLCAHRALHELVNQLFGDLRQYR